MTESPRGSAGPRLRVGQVGLGWFGRIHAETWLSIPGVDLVGVCDQDPARLSLTSGRAAQSSFHVDAAEDPLVLPSGVARHADLDELTAGGIDVLDVVVDEPAHAETVRRGLEAGLDVIVEKPVALAAGEVRELVALASKRGVHLYVGHILRFDARNVALGARLDPSSIRHLSFQRNFQQAAHQVYGRVHPVFGAMIHDIDLALWYTGRRPRAVTAYTSGFLDAATPDVLDVVLHWDNDLRAVLQNSWHLSPSCPYGFEFECKVQAERATYVIRNEPDIQVWDHAGASSPDVHFWPSNHGSRSGSLRAELEHFARCSTERVASDRVPLEQVLWAAETADAVLTAAADPGRGPVTL